MLENFLTPRNLGNRHYGRQLDARNGRLLLTWSLRERHAYQPYGVILKHMRWLHPSDCIVAPMSGCHELTFVTRCNRRKEGSSCIFQSTTHVEGNEHRDSQMKTKNPTHADSAGLQKEATRVGETRLAPIKEKTSWEIICRRLLRPHGVLSEY